MNKLRLTIIACYLVSTSFAQKLGAPELIQIMEKSSLTYQLGMLEEDLKPKNYDKLLYNNYYIEEEKNEIKVKKYVIGSTFQNAESLYQKGKYKEARAEFQKVADIAKALTRIGQCYQREGDLSNAKTWLDKAIKLNFHDFEAHWALANIYVKQKQTDKAMREITTAHILNRNHQEIKQNLDAIYKTKALKTGNWEFTPQVSMEKEEKDVKLQFEPNWMGYAMPLAVRKYEPGLIEKLGENKVEQNFNPVMEGLMALYTIILRDENLRRQAQFAYLKKAMEGQQLNSFAYYEVVLRENPDNVYYLSEKTILQVSDYLTKMRSAEIR